MPTPPESPPGQHGRGRPANRDDGPERRVAGTRAGLPTVVQRTAAGERLLDAYSRLLSERVIYLGTEIDDDVANVVVAQLLYLDAESTEQTVNLYLNSPGGSMSATMAIYDTMQYIAASVATTCVGQASSGAALLLAAGTAGRRSVLPHARVLLHQPPPGGRHARAAPATHGPGRPAPRTLCAATSSNRRAADWRRARPGMSSRKESDDG